MPVRSSLPFFARFAEPPMDARPMMRWWWFGPAVEETELDRELQAMKAAGIGGVEVSYVYPLGGEPAPLGSEAFCQKLRHAADTARRLGLRFDMTLGSGWSFGGPHIGHEHAARGLHWERHEIQPGALEIPVRPGWPGDEFLAAYLGNGSLQEPPESCDLLEPVDGVLHIPAGVGTRQVLLLWSRLTGQNVKRAAFGAEGPVLDHMSRGAIEQHLAAFGDVLLDAVPAELIGSVFCDSLEVYGADHTPAAAAEFEARRGRPLLPEAWKLVIDAPGSQALRADYHLTLAELYEENFLQVVRAWAAGRGVRFRIQNYGQPPARVSAYRFADLFEGEGWGWKEITQTRWASSAAHLYGQRIVSSETWTWIHSPSFRATPLDIQGEAHEHLLLGINQFVGHGWPYSPHDAPGLGWFFYASGALDDRNPWWGAARQLFDQLSRLCQVMREGEHVADVALYLPERDLFAQMGLATGGSLDPWHEAVARIGTDVTAAVRGSGLDFDLIDDTAILENPERPYSTVIVAAATEVPEATRRWLESGDRTVLLVDSAVEIAGALRVDDLRSSLSQVQPADAIVDAPEVGFVHRRAEAADIFLLANTGDEVRTFTFSGRGLSGSYEVWDPRTGTVVGVGQDRVELSLHPYQALVVVVHQGAAPELGGRGDSTGTTRVDLGDWTVSFDGGAAEPVTIPHVWEDGERRHFSGTASYQITVRLDRLDGARLLIDAVGHDEAGSSARVGMVGRSYRATPPHTVREAVQVLVNGVDLGWLWAPPFDVEIGHALRPGENTIELRVANTAANALAVEDHIEDLAAASERRYGRRFRMQQLDQAMASTRSGLLAEPYLLI